MSRDTNEISETITDLARRGDVVAVIVLTKSCAFHWTNSETFEEANDIHTRLVDTANNMLSRVDRWAKKVLDRFKPKPEPDPVLRVIEGLGLGGGKGHVVDHDSVVLGSAGGSGGGGRDGSCMDSGDSRQSSHDSPSSSYSSDTGGGSDSSGGSSCD